MCMFNGYNVQVTKYFTQNFNGERAKIGDTKLHRDEELITRVTKVPLNGECWSNMKMMKEIPWSVILVSPECKYDYKGMPIYSIK
jgi:hypothetical protein